MRFLATTMGSVAIALMPVQALASDNDIQSREDVLVWYQGYENCIQIKALLNSEARGKDLTSIVDTARPQCNYEWTQFQTSYLRGSAPNPEFIAQIENWRSVAEAKAVNELKAIAATDFVRAGAKAH